jgi:hypothetical protein
MAYTTISGADQTLLRSDQSIPDLAMYVTPLQEVVTGMITALPIKYPTVSLTVTWDGATTDVSVGQMVRISNGTTIRAYGVVRKAVSGSTLYISETPLGAYGYATMIESPILVGDTVTIYNHRPLWGMYSRIDAKTKTFYKMWDVPYASQNEGILVVANAGPWQAARLQAGETTARFSLPRSGTNSSYSLSGSLTVTSVLWTLPSGVSLVDGYADTDFEIEVNAEAGYHLIAMTATRSSTSHTAYVWLFVSDGSSTLSFDDRYSVSVPEGDSQSRLGREMTVTVTGENLQDTLYPGAGVMLREWPEYDGSALSETVGVDTFIGYLAEMEFSHDGNIGTARLKLESPMVYAQRIVQAPQSLEEVTEATKWTECESVISNPCGFAYYLIKHHTPALLDMHDFDALDYLTPRRKYLQCTTRNLGAALQVVADYISGNIGSASDGTTLLRANPLYLGQADRDAVPTLMTFQEQDVRAPLDYKRRGYNAYAEVRGGAFAYAGGNPKAFYAGRRWSQGAGSTEMPNFSVTVAQGISEVKARIGHFFAEQNAEIQEIGLGLVRNIDIVDPAYMVWSALTVSDTYDPYGLGFSSNRLLPVSIEREWSLDAGGIKKQITVTCQGETFGQAGEELPVGSAKGLSQNGYSVGSPTIWKPYVSSGMFGGAQSASLVMASNNEGDLAVCFNYFSAIPEWVKLNESVLSEVTNDWCFDYGSPYFANGRDASQSLGVYVLATNSTEAHVWYFADILRSLTAEKIHSVTLSDSTLETEGRILCAESYPLLVLVGLKDGTGTRYTRSIDGGASFGSLTRVGSAITDLSINDNAPLGMWVDGQRQLISAPDSTPVYGTYYASTAGGSFSKLTGSHDSAFPQKMVNIDPDSTTAYVTSIDVVAKHNNFDGADDWTYNAAGPSGAAYEWDNYIDSADWTYNGISAGGYSGNAPKWTGVNLHGAGVGVDIAGMAFFPGWPSSFTFYGISFRAKHTVSVGSTTMDYALPSGAATLQGEVDVWTDFAFFPSNESTLPRSSNVLQLVFAPTNNISSTVTVWIDDVVIYIGAGAKLWKVTSFTGSPTWTDISPATGEAPERPYDFAIDKVDNSILHAVTAVGGDWYKSTNGGTSWSSFLSNTALRVPYSVGTSLLAAGQESAVLSFNSGSSFADIAGNLSTAWGSIGLVKKAVAL